MRVALLSFVVLGCAGSLDASRDPGHQATTSGRELADLRTSMASHQAQLDAEEVTLDDVESQQRDNRERLNELEAVIRDLNTLWDEVTSDYRAAASAYEAAAAAFDAARTSASEASATYVEAREEWKRAATTWKFAALMIAAAHAIETHRLNGGRLPDTARQTDLACDQCMSTQTFRRARGVASGMDVDHIVPRSLGGADHPLNYRVISAHVNRSMGNLFDASKCASTGAMACALAVAVSTRCGEYRGGIPGD